MHAAFAVPSSQNTGSWVTTMGPPVNSQVGHMTTQDYEADTTYGQHTAGVLGKKVEMWEGSRWFWQCSLSAQRGHLASQTSLPGRLAGDSSSSVALGCKHKTRREYGPLLLTISSLTGCNLWGRLEICWYESVIFQMGKFKLRGREAFSQVDAFGGRVAPPKLPEVGGGLTPVRCEETRKREAVL